MAKAQRIMLSAPCIMIKAPIEVTILIKTDGLSISLESDSNLLVFPVKHLTKRHSQSTIMYIVRPEH